VKKKYAIIFLSIHFIGSLAIIRSKWDRKISWIVESACKIRKASLIGIHILMTIAVSGCNERYKVM